MSGPAVACEVCREARAVWHYAPWSPSAQVRDYCDECVPRGCSCNEPLDGSAETLDECGRRYPCCEYDYVGDDS